MPKIKKQWRIHIICGALTLLMVLSTYIFYDDTIGRMMHKILPLEREEITKSQIDENYKLAAEIPLTNDILINYDPFSRYLLYETKRDNISTDDMIVFVESASSPISLYIDGDERLSEDGKYYYRNNSWVGECTGGEGIRLGTERGVNYSFFLNFEITTKPVKFETTYDAPKTLNGAIKIYERIGGEESE